jgi:hypothetical protein
MFLIGAVITLASLAALITGATYVGKIYHQMKHVIYGVDIIAMDNIVGGYMFNMSVCLNSNTRGYVTGKTHNHAALPAFPTSTSYIGGAYTPSGFSAGAATTATSGPIVPVNPAWFTSYEASPISQ